MQESVPGWKLEVDQLDPEVDCAARRPTVPSPPNPQRQPGQPPIGAIRRVARPEAIRPEAAIDAGEGGRRLARVLRLRPHG